MLPLPPVAPATGWRASTRLARDHYVRLDGNDYSVHPAVIGRRVEVVADLRPGAGALRRPGGGRPRPVWAKHQTITDPEHVAAAKALRAARIGLLPSGAARRGGDPVLSRLRHRARPRRRGRVMPTRRRPRPRTWAPRSRS